MNIGIDEISYVADLARLKFTNEELISFEKDLNNILVYFQKLNEIDTTGVLPTAHILDIKNRFRGDDVLPSIPRDEALSNSASVMDGCFKVPKIIE